MNGEVVGGAALGGLPLISTAGQLAGSYLGYLGQQQTNTANTNIAQNANQLSAAEAGNEMGFQAMMSDTQYQRGVADLKAAGLNPMLAMSQGQASSPSGAMGSVTTPNLQNPMKSFENLGSTLSGSLSMAIDAMKAKSAMDLNRSNMDVNSAQADNLRAQTSKTGVDTQKSQQDLVSGKSRADESSAFDTVFQMIKNSLNSSTQTQADRNAKQIQNFRNLIRQSNQTPSMPLGAP